LKFDLSVILICSAATWFPPFQPDFFNLSLIAAIFLLATTFSFIAATFSLVAATFP
jgi:hypothetical protein